MEASEFFLLYRQHRDAVFGFAYRMTGSVEHAEDIAHDCFLSLLRNPQRFDPARGSLRTYLYGAARNLALKHFRDSGGETAVEECPDAPAGPSFGEPLRQLLDEELAERVREEVAALPVLQREALILFEYEELSLQEIAGIVAADAGVVKARLHRARARLRRQLAPLLGKDLSHERSHRTCG